MAQHYRFFNSAEGDIREYLASDFAEYFNRFLSDGIYTDNGKVGLQVKHNTGLKVNIETGYAYVRGYMYKNDAVISLQLDPADSMLDRIDRIVLKFDEVERKILIALKKGTFSSTPQPPVITVNSTVKEMTLAQIRIKKGATSIVASDITDERFTENCGLVSSLISIPVEEMWNVWNGSLANIQSAWEEWFQGRQNDLGARVLTGAKEPTGVVAGDIWLKEIK